MKPEPAFFEHDCSKCHYLGSATVLDEKLDFYFHLAEGRPANEAFLIYRYGSEGGDYGSNLADYTSPLSFKALLALGLYIEHLGCNSAFGGFVKGHFAKNGQTVLKLHDS